MYTDCLCSGYCRDEFELIDDEADDVPPLCHDAHACMSSSMTSNPGRQDISRNLSPRRIEH
jgi:hypothetical protein